MQYRKEENKKKIKEFLDLVENHKIEIRHYKNPVLVWSVNEGVCHYSFWEEDTLSRFGLQNVDGWDFEEDLLFCPDWVAEDDDEDDIDDEDDYEDLCAFCEKIVK